MPLLAPGFDRQLAPWRQWCPGCAALMNCLLRFPQSAGRNHSQPWPMHAGRAGHDRACCAVLLGTRRDAPAADSGRSCSDSARRIAARGYLR